MKKELIELARKKGVDVDYCGCDNSRWHAIVDDYDGHSFCKYEVIKKVRKLSTLIKFLADNKIKIKN